MVGLGEKQDEVLALMDDFVDIGLNVMTIGQYLQPTKMHLPVEEFIHPDVFQWYKEAGEAKGIEHVESGPLYAPPITQNATRRPPLRNK